MNISKRISRRDALKYMGTTVLSLTLSVGGISAISSYTEKEKKRLVFYFTATGNCLYVAKNFSGTLISIPQILNDRDMVFEADEIGLVYPIYGHMPPKIVREFLRKATLKAPYLFAILTYGSQKCNAVELLDEEARRVGLNFNYITTFITVDNYLPAFDMNVQIRMDKKEDLQLEKTLADVSAKKNWKEPVTEAERQEHKKQSPSLLDKRSEELLVIDNGHCIHCGLCVKVCPKGNFELTDQEAIAEGDCEFCLACIQNCPPKAIKLSISEVNPDARYRNPNISLAEIVRSNNQSKIL